MGYFRKTIVGISWTGALRGSTRIIAFLKIAVLARLLTPAQFGLFGIAALVLAFLEILTETGMNVFLIQGEGKIEDYINSAWAVSIIRGMIISAIIVISAPFIASFFKSPDSYRLILLISLVPFLRGFINPAIIKFQKELQFNREFALRFSIFFVDASFAVFFVLITRDASGLVWGLIAGVVLEVILSFILFKPRPTLAFEFEKVKRVVGRGKWVTAAGVFKYLFEQGDDIVVGRLLSTSSLGLYQIAYKISTLPITEVAQVFSKVTFPVYVKISKDAARLKRAFIKTTTVIALLVIPIGLILFFFPEKVILIILGPNWLEAASTLRVLSVFGVIKAVSDSSYALFMAVKKQEYVTVLTLVSIFGLAVTIIPLVLRFGIVGAAISALIGLSLSIPVVVYYSRKVFSDLQ